MKRPSFLSGIVSWRRVWLVSLITTLVVVVLAAIPWYLFFYLPVEQHLMESVRLSNELKKVYEANPLLAAPHTQPKK